MDLVGICKRQYDYSARVLTGEMDDDSYLPIIYELDPEDDYNDPGTWIKANPNLGISVDREDLATQVKRGNDNPVAKAMMLTKRFNQWCSGNIEFVDTGRWIALKSDYEPMEGDPVIVGLDLSSTSDISAISLLFSREDGRVFVTGRYYLPESQVVTGANRNYQSYQQWQDKGLLTVTPGEVIDYDQILADLTDIMTRYDVEAVCYDPWNAAQLIRRLGDNAPVVPIRQGYQTLSPATKELQRYALTERITHDGCPILTWAMGNVTLEMDAAGNIKPSKLKSDNKIDPVAALVCSFSRFMATAEDMPIDLGEVWAA